VSPEYAAVTEYAPAGRTSVEHDAPPSLTDAVQRVDAPAVKVTLPVAPLGRSDAERPTVPPYAVLDGLADASNEVTIRVMEKVVVAVDPA
jgi:hypothetical protein